MFATLARAFVSLPARALLTATCLLSAACEDQPAAPAVKAAAVVASPPAAATSAVSGLAAYSLREIAKGPGPTGAFLAPFSIERRVGDENHSWLEANLLCQSQGKALCTETQWLKACSLDSTLGTLESWTLTSDYPGAAVRGGDGCGDRSFVKTKEKSPTRVGVCCSRAVALSTPVTTGTFREEMNDRIVKYEAALNQGETVALVELYGDTIRFGKEELEPTTLIERHIKELENSADLLFVFDRCVLKEFEDGLNKEIYADCNVGYHKGGVTRAGSQRIAWTNDFRIAYYGDAKDYTRREVKERVNGFISSPP